MTLTMTMTTGTAASTTMTEPKRPRAQTRLLLTTLELRLYVVALLAVVYVVTWRAIAPAVEVAYTAAAEPTVEPTVVRPGTGAERAPPVRAATRVTDPPPSRTRQPPRVVRVPARRVRTRSS